MKGDGDEGKTTKCKEKGGEGEGRGEREEGENGVQKQRMVDSQRERGKR